MRGLPASCLCRSLRNAPTRLHTSLFCAARCRPLVAARAMLAVPGLAQLSGTCFIMFAGALVPPRPSLLLRRA